MVFTVRTKKKREKKERGEGVAEALGEPQVLCVRFTFSIMDVTQHLEMVVGESCCCVVTIAPGVSKQLLARWSTVLSSKLI